MGISVVEKQALLEFNDLHQRAKNSKAHERRVSAFGIKNDIQSKVHDMNQQ